MTTVRKKKRGRAEIFPKTQAHLHVHPLPEGARRARDPRGPVQLLVLPEVVEALLPRLEVGVGDHPLEADRVQPLLREETDASVAEFGREQKEEAGSM